MGAHWPLDIGISFSPYGHTYGRYGTDAYAKLREQGYAAADLNLANTDTEVYTLTETELSPLLHQWRQAAEGAGVTLSQVHGPWRWPPQDSTEAERAERLEKMERAVVITALLGAKHLVLHPIMPYGIDDLPEGKAEDTFRLNLQFFQALADCADRHGVILCIENMPMPHFSLSTPDQVLRLVQTIRRDSVKLCLDTGHVAVFPHLSVEAEIRRVGGELCVLHLHDNDGTQDAHCYPGDGIISWERVGEALQTIGYDGVLSLETAPSGGYDDPQFEAESRRLNQRLRDVLSP